MEFETVLSLPQNILKHGISGEIERIMLFDKIGRSPDSANSKYLVRTSSKYGLIEGGNTSSFLKVTEDGRLALGDPNVRSTAEKRFQLAVGQFEPFSTLYTKLKNQRLPDQTVLGGELERLGVSANDRKKAAEIFAANVRFVGLTNEISNGEFVRDVEEVLRQKSQEDSGPANGSDGLEIEPAAVPEPSSVGRPDGPAPPQMPGLHIDIQVHIDASASPEQIDQVFSSMARHLYGREP